MKQTAVLNINQVNSNINKMVFFSLNSKLYSQVLKKNKNVTVDVFSNNLMKRRRKVNHKNRKV